MKKMKRETEPFTAMGVAAYAMMQSLVTGMVQTDRKEAAMAILDNASEWLFEKENFKRSTRMKQAHERLRNLQQQLELLGKNPAGPMQ